MSTTGNGKRRGERERERERERGREASRKESQRTVASVAWAADSHVKQVVEAVPADELPAMI